MPAIRNYKSLSKELLQVIRASGHDSMRRLKSEREICGQLGVSRTMLRKAFRLLEEDGILARRHGSGVYIRKVPPAEGPGLSDGQTTISANLFAGDDETSRRHVTREQIPLKVGVWWTPSPHSRSGLDFLRGIEDECRFRGLHSIIFDPFGDIDPAEADACDAYLVNVEVQQHFARICGDRNVPRAYLLSTSPQSSNWLEPMLCIDSKMALRRAMRIMKDLGSKRIAMLGINEPWLSNSTFASAVGSSVARCYHDTVMRLGLSEHLIALADANEESSGAALKSLFDRQSPPDALYVADDILLLFALPHLEAQGLIPGQNLRIITYSNATSDLPKGYSWSQMQFNPGQLGGIAILSILRELESANTEILSFSHQPHFIQGTTHLLNEEQGSLGDIPDEA